MTTVFPSTSWSLIARLPDQPHLASALIGLYADAIGTYLRMRLAGEPGDLREDVIQQVLVELLEKPEALAKATPGTGSRFRYFLMHLAWQIALNVLRYHRRRSHASLEGDPDGQAHLGEPLHDRLPASHLRSDMDRAWARSVVQQALDEARIASQDSRLEPEAFMVLWENLVAGRPLRAIAQSMGSSLAASSRRLARGRQFLRNAIAERLRLSGELGADEDASVAGDCLIAALAAR